MKTNKGLLLTSALLLLGAYSIYTTVRIQRLETRRRESDGRLSTSEITYAFDDSLRWYFGQKGVAEVERALEILGNPKIEQAPKNEEVHLDFLMDPPRLDGR